MGGWFDGVRAVFFDVGGTLLHPIDAAGVYARIGRKYGSALDTEAIRQQLREAFMWANQLHARPGSPSDDSVETDYWREVVGRTLPDVHDRDGCFRKLFEHFAQPRAWRLADGAAEVVRYFLDKGLPVGLASNFDRRLYSVLAGHPEVQLLGPILISSEIGWRKPDARFYQALAERTGLPPDEIVMIGDDRANDYEGAKAAGLRAIILDPRGLSRDCPERIERLTDLLHDAGSEQ